MKLVLLVLLLLVHLIQPSLTWGEQPRWRPSRPLPQEIMVDSINYIGLVLLNVHNHNNDNNIALSPYGAASVLVALGEGVQGTALDEILRATFLPLDISVTRIGLRDIHRHLKSYFIPEEGFLAGLTFSHENVTLKQSYESILKFYGYDVDSFNNALYPDPPTTTSPVGISSTTTSSFEMTTTESSGFVSTTSADSITESPTPSSTNFKTTTPISTTPIQTTEGVEVITTRDSTTESTTSEEDTSERRTVVSSNTFRPTPIERTTTESTSTGETVSTRRTATDKPIQMETTTSEPVTEPTTEQHTNAGLDSTTPPISTTTLPQLTESRSTFNSFTITTSNIEMEKTTRGGSTTGINTITDVSARFGGENMETMSSTTNTVTAAKSTSSTEDSAGTTIKLNNLATTTDDLTSTESSAATETLETSSTTNSATTSKSTGSTNNLVGSKELNNLATNTVEFTKIDMINTATSTEAATATKTSESSTTNAVTASKSTTSTENLADESATELSSLATNTVEFTKIDSAEASETPTSKFKTIGTTTEETSSGTTLSDVETKLNDVEGTSESSTLATNIESITIIASLSSTEVLETRSMESSTTSTDSGGTEENSAIDARPTEALETTATEPSTTLRDFDRSQSLVPMFTDAVDILTDMIDETMSDETVTKGVERRTDFMDEEINNQNEKSTTFPSNPLGLFNNTANEDSYGFKTTNPTGSANNYEMVPIIRNVSSEEEDLVRVKLLQRSDPNSSADIDDSVLENSENRTRGTRSLIDYIIARYQDSRMAYQRGYTPVSFENDKTTSFSVNGKRESNIRFMTYDIVLPFRYIAYLNALALTFPLDSNKYYLLLVLPVDEMGIDSLVDNMMSTTLKQIIYDLQPTRVKATIPSFMLKGYVVLTPTLQKLGIKQIFEPRHADFSKMTDDKDIYITNIEQAITVTIKNYVDPASMDMEDEPHFRRRGPVHFTADHPFLYFVMDAELHVALMAGKIVNPLNSRIR